MKTPLLALCLLALSLHPLAAAPDAPASPEQAELEKGFREIAPQKGSIALKNNLATVKVPEGLQYLTPKDARFILVKIWGNPPESTENVLGMLVPSPEETLKEDGWGIVISYSEDGHVDDADAAKINFTTLLKEMQEGTEKHNEERAKQGYERVHLKGWAEPPHYDAITHKIYWAKELAFDRNDASTLNYCTRILGRRGVLELNAVASMKTLPAIREQAQHVITNVDFNQGNRYADFDKSSDKTATYGVAALVAGGVAAKTGLFKGLIALLLAGKKLVIVGVIAIWAAIKKALGRKE